MKLILRLPTKTVEKYEPLNIHNYSISKANTEEQVQRVDTVWKV